VKPIDLAGAAALLALVAGATAAGAWAVRPLPPPAAGPSLESTRSLTIAVQDGALPLAGTDADGRPAGMHVAVARAVCDRLAVDCAFAVTATDRLFDSLESGAVDMVAADLAVTAERADHVRFLRPHARAASLLVARAGTWPEAAGADPGALAGRVVVAASGTDQARALATLVPPDATLVLAQHPRDGVAALLRGDADAALLPLALALEVLAAPTGAHLVAPGPPLTAGPAGGPVALAVARGDDRLAAAADAALAALDRDGTLLALTRASGDPAATVLPAAPPIPSPDAPEARP
jgi:polar amino acid transport system substrate-binding protein